MGGEKHKDTIKGIGASSLEYLIAKIEEEINGHFCGRNQALAKVAFSTKVIKAILNFSQFSGFGNALCHLVQYFIYISLMSINWYL